LVRSLQDLVSFLSELHALHIGAAVAVGYWYLWVRCPACRMISAVDLRTLDRHPDAALTSLIPALSCVMPPERALCRTGAIVANKHR
jgi:hypothetical protein